MPHRDPTPHDAPAPDPDATGYDPREHEHGQHAAGLSILDAAAAGAHICIPRLGLCTFPPAHATDLKYQVWHHERALSPEYDTPEEAALFRDFETPGTDDYVVKPVRASDPTPDRRTPPRFPPRTV